MSAELTPEQHRVLRLRETEKGGSGELLYHFEIGTYHCVGCGALLFHSHQKYDSGTGWPAFTDANTENILLRPDPLHGMQRWEAACSNCEGHLGHFFDDLDSPSLKRYCINSVVLRFVAQA